MKTIVCVNCCQPRLEDQFAIKPNGRRKRWCNECRRHLKNMNARRNRALAQRGVSDSSGQSYVSRNEWLKLLGFSSYRDYLQSELWKSIRKRVYQEKGRDCFLCGEPAQALHHNRYHKNDLLGKKIRFIFPICNGCHESIEFDNDGSKVNVMQAAKSFRAARRQQAGRR